MKPERIEELRRNISQSCGGSVLVWLDEVIDDLDAANTELQRLQAKHAQLRELAYAVQDSMGSVGGIPITDRLADAFAACGMDVEREIQSSPAPVAGGVPELTLADVIQAVDNGETVVLEQEGHSINLSAPRPRKESEGWKL